MDVTGSGQFVLLVDNVDINTAAAGDVAFALDFSGSAQNGDVTFRNTSGSDVNDFSCQDRRPAGRGEHVCQ
jgi:hypothetical protein